MGLTFPLKAIIKFDKYIFHFNSDIKLEKVWPENLANYEESWEIVDGTENRARVLCLIRKCSNH